MLTCWQVLPDDRPTFTQISQQLMTMLEQANIQNYLDVNECTDVEQINDENNVLERDDKPDITESRSSDEVTV